MRVSDVRGHGGSNFAYRLAIRLPHPGFTASFSPTAPRVWKDGAVPISISCERTDGFEGAIHVRLDNLPSGFSAPESTIPAGENSTALALFADADAMPPPTTAPKLKLVATAKMDGRDVTREVLGELPVPVETGDIVTRVQQSELTIQPGREARLTVQVERRNDFKGRIPIEVRGLPHGTRVLDVGLNGILITERESSRVVTFYCEPWAEPTTQAIVVVARREGQNTEHAAKSVLLHVLPNSPVTADRR